VYHLIFLNEVFYTHLFQFDKFHLIVLNSMRLKEKTKNNIDKKGITIIKNGIPSLLNIKNLCLYLLVCMMSENCLKD